MLTKERKYEATPVVLSSRSAPFQFKNGDTWTVHKDAVFKFFKEECPNLKLAPERGVEEPVEDGYTQIKVTGKVQTPWFGAGVGMNMSWRFLLNSEGKIFFVAIDLLASPQELLKLAR